MAEQNSMVPMEEYEALKKDLKTAQKENQKLQKIISLGSISTLSTLIDQYLAFSQAHFRKIAREIQLTDYSRDNVEKVIRLLDHLEYARKELHVFIDLHEEGIAGLHPRFQSCLFTGTAIVHDLERLGTLLDMSEEQTVELQEMLREFQYVLEKFIERVKEEHP